MTSIVRLLDCQHGTGSAPDLNQEHFVNWVRFLRHCATNSFCTIIASNFGDYGVAGTGEEYHDESDSALENAFIVAHFDQGVAPFTLLVQWADLAAFGASPGDPAKMDNGTLDGVAVSFAFREDGTQPWAGDTDDDGTDAKGGTVWTAGSSIVHVFPRSNNTGGSHNTNKENMMRVGADDSTGNARAHWVATKDGIFQLYSVADNGVYVASFFGRYTVQVGLSTTAPYITHPYCAIAYYSGFWLFGPTRIHGGTAGSSPFSGGIVGRISDGVEDLSMDINEGRMDSTMQPNQMNATPAYASSPIVVCQNGTVASACGYLPTELVQMVFGPDNHAMNAAGDRSYLGVTTAAAFKWAISHDGGAALGTNGDRRGRLSYTA